MTLWLTRKVNQEVNQNYLPPKTESRPLWHYPGVWFHAGNVSSVLKLFFAFTMTHTNHYRSFGERLPMVKFTITDDKSDTSYSHATKQILKSLCVHYRYIFLITIHISRNGYDSRNTVRLRIVQTRRETTFLPSPLLDDWQWRDTRVLTFWVRRAYNLRLLIEFIL